MYKRTAPIAFDPLEAKRSEREENKEKRRGDFEREVGGTEEAMVVEEGGQGWRRVLTRERGAHRKGSCNNSVRHSLEVFLHLQLVQRTSGAVAVIRVWCGGCGGGGGGGGGGC